MSGAIRARVVTLRICTNPQCREGPAPHLLAQHATVSVARGAATAISYAWGALDRSKRFLGHYDDGRLLEMELGDEWNIADLQNALHKLCTDQENPESHRFIWIDQLCIVQTDDEEIRATLAKIPDIYKSFSVVVLMPGAICQCQAELGEDVRHFNSSAHQHDCVQEEDVIKSLQTTCEHPTDWYERLVSAPFHTVRCLNNMAFNQYFSRVWTRQELLYATEMRMQWVCDEHTPCVMAPSSRSSSTSEVQEYALDTLADVEKLHPIARHYVLIKLVESRSQVEEDADTKPLPELLQNIAELARAETVYAWHNVFETVREWNIYHASYGDDGAEYWRPGTIRKLQFMMQQLLSGDVIRDDNFIQGSSLENEKRLTRFLTVFGQIRRSSRAATQARDYVVAVWVDCPDYQLPHNFKKLTMSDLLQDAVDQLLLKHSQSFLATCPAGLLTDATVTSAWAPGRLLGEIKATSCEEIYSSVILSCEAPINLEHHQSSLDRPRASVANTAWETLTPAEIIDMFLRSVCSWALDPSLAVMRYEHQEIQHGEWGLWQPRELEITNKLMFRLCSIVATACDECYENEDLRKAIILLPEIQPEEMPGELMEDLDWCKSLADELDCAVLIDTIFYVVCVALRIDVVKAKQFNLNLIHRPLGKSLEQPPMLGLGRANYAFDKAETSTFYASNTQIGNTIDAAVYEATLNNDSDGEASRYNIVGVWVASQDLGLSGISGIMDSGNGDSFVE